MAVTINIHEADIGKVKEGMRATVRSELERGKNYDAVDPNKPVVCLLPGRVRKVGGMMTYLERRKPAEMAASECEIRGGEYTLYDRANYETVTDIARLNGKLQRLAENTHASAIYVIRGDGMAIAASNWNRPASGHAIFGNVSCCS